MVMVMVVMLGGQQTIEFGDDVGRTWSEQVVAMTKV